MQNNHYSLSHMLLINFSHLRFMQQFKIRTYIQILLETGPTLQQFNSTD